MDQNILKLLVLTAAVLSLCKANAQQRVQDFLKPKSTMLQPIDNRAGQTPVEYRRYCAQTNPHTISCKTYVPALPSGGGTWFGPWYWVQADLPPAGYKFQSSSFSLPPRDENGKPIVGVDDFCYGDDNSPMLPADPRGVVAGNPDNSYMGHKNGRNHAHANCYIQRLDGPKWVYNFQGKEGSCVTYLWPGNSDEGNIGLQIKCDGKNKQITEPAELDVVYVTVK